jgi:hypothetical protein
MYCKRDFGNGVIFGARTVSPVPIVCSHPRSPDLREVSITTVEELVHMIILCLYMLQSKSYLVRLYDL